MPARPSEPHRFSRLLRITARHPRTVLALALVLGLLALPGALRLRPDLELASLLPTDSATAGAYRTFLERFGGVESIYVLFTTATDRGEPVPSETLLEASWELEALLATSPLVAHVRSGIEPADEIFLLEHVALRTPLLVPEERFEELLVERLSPRSLSERAQQLRRRSSLPGSEIEMTWARYDVLGIGPRLGLSQSEDLPLDPLTSSFLSSDGGAALLVVTPSAGELAADAGRQLLELLEVSETAMRAALRSRRVEEGRGEHEISDVERIEVLAVGGPLYAAQDEALLRGDLERTLATSALASFALLVLAFGSLGPPIACLVAVGLALAWTGGVLSFFPRPTGLGLGFAAVLVGLGLDYGIHAAARFRERLYAGRAPREALVEALERCGPALIAAALTTVSGFSVLLWAELRPLREVGLLVSIGVALMVLSTLSVGGALFLLFERRAARSGEVRRRDGSPLWRWGGRLVSSVVSTAQRHRRAVLVVVLLSSLAALPGLARLELETDLRTLRPVHSEIERSETMLAESFGLGSETATAVVEAETLDLALERTRAACRLLRSELSVTSSIECPADWWLSDRRVRERLRRLAALGGERAGERTLDLAGAAARLEQELRSAGLDPQAFAPGLEALRAMAAGRDPAGRRTLDDAPDLIASALRPPEGERPAAVAIRLRLEDETWPDGPPSALTSRLEEVAPGTGIGSTRALAADLRDAASHDIRRLSLVALAVIAVVVLIGLRGRWAASAAALLPVTLAVVWSLGTWGWLVGRLDLIGVAVLPILLGIGIDDGLHAVHGLPSETSPGSGRLRGLDGAVREAGRAMVLTTMTTCAGFASLGLSSVPGLRRGGILVSLGVALSLAATLLVLPALSTESSEAGTRDPRGPGPGGEVGEGAAES